MTVMDVSIVTPEAQVWQGEAEMVVARSPDGEFAILRGHIPFLAALVPGLVKVYMAGGDRDQYVVTGGALEASGTRDDYHVIILADDADQVGDISDAELAQHIEQARLRTMEQIDERAEAGMRAALARPELGRD